MKNRKNKRFKRIDRMWHEQRIDGLQSLYTFPVYFKGFTRDELAFLLYPEKYLKAHRDGDRRIDLIWEKVYSLFLKNNPN